MMFSLPDEAIVAVYDEATNTKTKMTYGEYRKMLRDKESQKKGMPKNEDPLPYEEFVKMVDSYAEEHYTWKDALDYMTKNLSEGEKKELVKVLSNNDTLIPPTASGSESALATAETASKENPVEEASLPDWWGATSSEPYAEYDPKAQADWIAQREQEKERVTGDIPKHYQFECCGDAMVLIKEALGPEKFLGFCQGNILKYAVRANRKGLFYDNMDKIQRYAAWAKDAVQDS